MISDLTDTQIEGLVAVGALIVIALAIWTLYGLGRMLHSRANLNDARSERLKQRAEVERESIRSERRARRSADTAAE